MYLSILLVRERLNSRSLFRPQGPKSRSVKCMSFLTDGYRLYQRQFRMYILEHTIGHI